MIYQLYIELQESNPLVWRRIVVTAAYSFYQLHMAIQGAFGWENCHLFQFSENGFKDKICVGIPGDMDTDVVTIDAKKTKMAKVLSKENQAYSYIYDFGDSWHHRVILEKKLNEEYDRPHCIEGSGACPPEDVGGLGGYREMMKVFSGPRHKEKASYVEWLGLVPGEKWDPVFCSVREINKRFALLG